jgi:hypothetical protein
MEQTIQENPSPSWLEKPILSSVPRVRVETLIVIIILVLAVASRFYDLGLRTMAFDEINHVVPSWELATGQGYVHNPLSTCSSTDDTPVTRLTSPSTGS